MGWFDRKKSAAVENASSPGTPPLLHVEDEFTRLAAECASDTSGDSVSRLWKAVFELESWHFIQQFPPDGSTPEGPPPFGWPRPMASRIEGKAGGTVTVTCATASSSGRLPWFKPFCNFKTQP